MAPVMDATIVHIGIERNWRDVYAFAARPENMPLWASGLGSGLEPDGDDWVAHGPLGSVRVRFTPPNDLGVMDHSVTMVTGLVVHNALRVVPNGDGAEVMFTLLKLPGVSEDQFDTDRDWVQKDLATLKQLLEA
ncbi:SRPBCC family protein [Pararhizobium sp. YC-54]|uniref:SRPBCC family protein n=1 Tax=Pararhizobium sp. YC-54 TaxID=2986920 RepID=UPI0021F6AF57|nr:SRPBCC family protein [Pararhizobium sp. YC-54]MCV9996711.1 SRPBCC family protein [Pararhizobium sp. YC-54]